MFDSWAEGSDPLWIFNGDARSDFYYTNIRIIAEKHHHCFYCFALFALWTATQLRLLAVVWPYSWLMSSEHGHLVGQRAWWETQLSFCPRENLKCITFLRCMASPERFINTGWKTERSTGASVFCWSVLSELVTAAHLWTDIWGEQTCTLQHSLQPYLLQLLTQITTELLTCVKHHKSNVAQTKH